MPRTPDPDIPPHRSDAMDERRSTVRGSVGTILRRPAPPDRPGRDPGHYLTDGQRLFRNLSPLRGALGDRLIGLEDCRSLELVLMPIAEYVRLRDV